MVLYVDNAGIAAPTRKNVKDFVEELQQGGFHLDCEGNFTEYLGTRMEEYKDGTCQMSQKVVIEKIIKTTRMANCTPDWTPTTQVALGSNPKGELFKSSKLEYRIVVGMLL